MEMLWRVSALMQSEGVERLLKNLVIYTKIQKQIDCEKL